MIFTRSMRFGFMLAVGLFLAPPAHALSLPGCGPEEFLFYANKDIVLENGPVTLTGNLLSLTGSIHVGSDNIIHGTVSAANLFVGTSAVVDICATNNKTGTGTCGTTIPFAPEAACVFPPLPVPVFPANCLPGTNALFTTDATLQPGCYNQIRAGKLNGVGATVTLINGGEYFAKSEIRVQDGATLGAVVPGAPAIVTTKSQIISEANAKWTNMNLTTLAAFGNAILPGNANIFQNVVFFAPFGGAHPHTGSRLEGTTEFVSATALIQPIINTPPPGDIFCACPPGTELSGPPTLCTPVAAATSELSRFFRSLASPRWTPATGRYRGTAEGGAGGD